MYDVFVNMITKKKTTVQCERVSVRSSDCTSQAGPVFREDNFVPDRLR